MNELIIGLAVVLILAILLLLFRISTLIQVMRSNFDKTVGASNRINALMLLVFFIIGLVLFFWSFNHFKPYYLPKAASEHGISTDQMFWITMAILTFAFIVTNLFLFVFPYKYQYRADRKAYFYPDNHKLEIIWTIVPAVVMAILVYYGWKEWTAITRTAPPESVVVEVMGKQFNWMSRYPGKDNKFGGYNYKLIDATNEMGIDLSDPNSKDDFIPAEIHIPKGKPVLFKIRSRDVIHSVYAPHFRVKMDAVPGMPTKFWFTPLKTTDEMREDLGKPDFNYELACAEICGRGHFAMRYIIVVEEEDKYNEWVAAQKPWVEQNLDYASSKYPQLFQAPVKADSTAGKANGPLMPDSASVIADTTKADSAKVAEKPAAGKNKDKKKKGKK